ncbi:MAG TPA: hypothetical protein VF229_03960 [Burkholderiaceae bacterium]
MWLVDGRLRDSALLCVGAEALTLVGLIHSPFPDGRLFLPWASQTPGTVFALAVGYLLLGGLCAALALAARRGRVQVPTGG